MDYQPIQAFLVGRCGKSVRDAAMTSMEEYRLLAEGHEQHQREEWERLRWKVYMDWSISPNLKKRPRTPQDIIRFPWEKDNTSEVRGYEPLTENEIEQLSKIFGIKREDISNG